MKIIHVKTMGYLSLLHDFTFVMFTDNLLSVELAVLSVEVPDNLNYLSVLGGGRCV